jgi:two-component system response regulator ChvI
MMNDRSSVALVDDERAILASVTMTLEAEGFLVRPYADTASALSALRQSPADIALLDYSNSPFDGLELFRRLREFSDMPIIFLSARAEELRELDVGADGYISKPFSQPLVVERVRAVLQRHAKRDRST